MLAGGDRPIRGGTPPPGSRRRQQRLFEERPAAQLDVGDCYHCSLRAAAGRTNARRCCDQHITVEWGAVA